MARPKRTAPELPEADLFEYCGHGELFLLAETERTARKTYRSKSEAKADVFYFIELFFNPKRWHARSWYLSPIEFERRAGLA